MTVNEPKAKRLDHAIAASVNRHWRFCLVEGIILIILGISAFVIPRTLLVEFQFGWLFLLSGITGLIITLWVREAQGFVWSLVSAILAIAAGSLMLATPTKVFSLTLILVLFFIIEGSASIMYARERRRHGSQQWGWLLASGIVDLFLAALIIVALPGSAKWALGLLVGVNLISGGITLVATALQGRNSLPA
jgi:uncharacterized membrane protein HdeD (DUF308 family)